MLDAGSDLENSIFNALHGCYRAGFSALRSALELITIGACGSFANNRQIYADWRSGTVEFSFGAPCSRLADEPMLDRFNNGLRRSGQSLFDPKGQDTRGLSAGTQGSGMASFATMLTRAPVLPTAIFGAVTGRSMPRKCSETGNGRGCTPYHYAPCWFCWRARAPSGRRSRSCSPTEEISFRTSCAGRSAWKWQNEQREHANNRGSREKGEKEG